MPKEPLYPHVPKNAPYMSFDKTSRWPLLYVGKTKQFFIVLHLPLPLEGRLWIPVIDVTDIANELKLNQGLISNNEVVFGPGEAYAQVGDEGIYGMVITKDERRHQYRIEELAVDITIGVTSTNGGS